MIIEDLQNIGHSYLYKMAVVLTHWHFDGFYSAYLNAENKALTLKMIYYVNSFNYFMQSVSDDELDNAKHEVEFCIRTLGELEPAAKALSDTAPPNVTTENLSQNLFHIIAAKNWNDQFRNELMKTIGAQAKYIRLLERRTGR